MLNEEYSIHRKLMNAKWTDRAEGLERTYIVQ